MDYYEKLDKYYNLKNKYYLQLKKSNKTDKHEREKNKLNCINCKRPVGSLFYTVINPDDNTKTIYAKCGDKIKPCILNIEIFMGLNEIIPNVIEENTKLLKNMQEKLIILKNNSLFGYLNKEEIAKQFEDIKEEIVFLQDLISSNKELLNYSLDNENRNIELNTLIKNMYNNIVDIKILIEKYNTTKNTDFIESAVDIYIKILSPINQNLMNIKYKEIVINQFIPDEYILIQKKTILQDYENNPFDKKIIHYIVGDKITQKINKSTTQKIKQYQDENKTKTTKNKTKKNKNNDNNIDIDFSDNE